MALKRTFAPFYRARAAHLSTGLALAALLNGCGGGPPEGPPPGMGGATPVSVVTVQPAAVPVTLEYAAQTRGAQEAEVRARVTGILLKRNYTEGGVVKAGQSLFSLDPAAFQAALDRARADLAAAQARLDQARREAARFQSLFEANAVSQKEYDDAVSAEAITSADVLAAKARVQEAQLNLTWTRVESPISGVASRALKSEGTLVSGPDVLLTTVTQMDPMQVIFGISDNEQLRLRHAVQAGQLQWPKGNRFKVTVHFADGSEYARSGVVDFTDVRVSADTGTSEARAEMPNPEGVIHPGQFVHVRLSGAVRRNSYQVPQRAVLEGAQGKFVYVANAGHKAEVRPVEVAEWSGDNWVITRGLNAGDQVIVDGLLKLGPGAPVVIGTEPGQSPAAPSGAGK